MTSVNDSSLECHHDPSGGGLASSFFTNELSEALTTQDVSYDYLFRDPTIRGLQNAAHYSGEYAPQGELDKNVKNDAVFHYDQKDESNLGNQTVLHYGRSLVSNCPSSFTLEGIESILRHYKDKAGISNLSTKEEPNIPSPTSPLVKLETGDVIIRGSSIEGGEAYENALRDCRSGGLSKASNPRMANIGEDSEFNCLNRSAINGSVDYPSKTQTELTSVDNNPQFALLSLLECMVKKIHSLQQAMLSQSEIHANTLAAMIQNQVLRTAREDQIFNYIKQLQTQVREIKKDFHSPVKTCCKRGRRNPEVSGSSDENVAKKVKRSCCDCSDVSSSESQESYVSLNREESSCTSAEQQQKLKSPKLYPQKSTRQDGSVKQCLLQLEALAAATPQWANFKGSFEWHRRRLLREDGEVENSSGHEKNTAESVEKRTAEYLKLFLGAPTTFDATDLAINLEDIDSTKSQQILLSSFISAEAILYLSPFDRNGRLKDLWNEAAILLCGDIEKQDPTRDFEMGDSSQDKRQVHNSGLRLKQAAELIPLWTFRLDRLRCENDISFVPLQALSPLIQSKLFNQFSSAYIPLAHHRLQKALDRVSFLFQDAKSLDQCLITQEPLRLEYPESRTDGLQLNSVCPSFYSDNETQPFNPSNNSSWESTYINSTSNLTPQHGSTPKSPHGGNRKMMVMVCTARPSAASGKPIFGHTEDEENNATQHESSNIPSESSSQRQPSDQSRLSPKQSISRSKTSRIIEQENWSANHGNLRPNLIGEDLSFKDHDSRPTLNSLGSSNSTSTIDSFNSVNLSLFLPTSNGIDISQSYLKTSNNQTLKNEVSAIGESVVKGPMRESHQGVIWSAEENAWIAYWTDPQSLQQSALKFPVMEYGAEAARRLAIRCRRETHNHSANKNGIKSPLASQAKEDLEAPPRSEVPGVYWYRNRNGWVAQWFENGKNKHKFFAANIYGIEGAKERAIAYRLMKLEEKRMKGW